MIDRLAPLLELTREANEKFTRASISFLAPDSDVKRSFQRLLAALSEVPRGLVQGSLGPVEAPSKALRAQLTQRVAGWS